MIRFDINDKETPKKFCAHCEISGGECFTKLESNDKDGLLADIIETATNYRKEGKIAIFDIWEQSENKLVKKIIKGFINEQGEVIFQSNNLIGEKITLSEPVLLRGKIYNGHIYFLDGMHPTDTAGELCAVTKGKLIIIKGESGKRIIMPEYRGVSGLLRDNEIEIYAQ